MSASEYRSMPEYPLWAYAWPATVDRKVAPALDLYVSSRSAHLLVEVYSALDFSFAAWDTFQDVQLAVELAALQPFALPAGEVGILH